MRSERVFELAHDGGQVLAEHSVHDVHVFALQLGKLVQTEARKDLAVPLHVGQVATWQLVLDLALLKLTVQAAKQLALLLVAAEHGWHLLAQRTNQDHVRASGAHALHELVHLAVRGARRDAVQVAKQVLKR